MEFIEKAFVYDGTKITTVGKPTIVIATRISKLSGVDVEYLELIRK